MKIMDYGFLAALFAMSAFECAGQSSQPSADVVQTSQGYTIRITIPNSTTVAQPNCAVPLAPPPLVPPPQLCPPPLPPPVLVEPRRSGAAQVTVNVTIDGSGLPQQASPRPVAPDRGKVFCFRDLQVELRSLRLVDGNLVLTMSFSNLNAQKSVWVAFNSDDQGLVNGRLTDSGMEYVAKTGELTGIPVIFPGGYIRRGLTAATQIKPCESIFSTVKFLSRSCQRASAGSYDLQLELVVGHDIGTARADVSVFNLVTDVDTYLGRRQH